MADLRGIVVNGAIPVGSGPVTINGGGLPFNASGQLVVSPTVPTVWANGLPYSSDGGLSVAVDALPTIWSGGRPFNAAGQLCVSSNAASSWVAGFPFTAQGQLVVSGSIAPPVMKTVPNVVGLTEAAARTAITGASLVVGTVTQENHATVPAGNVISQSPAASTSVIQGSSVSFVVSLGIAQTLTSPNLTFVIPPYFGEMDSRELAPESGNLLFVVPAKAGIMDSRDLTGGAGGDQFTNQPGFTVTGTLAPDGDITIVKSGGGLGTGPSLVLFDDHRTGTIGQDAPLEATIGAWSSHVNSSHPKIAAGGRQGNCCTCWRGSNADLARHLRRRYEHPSLFSEMFYSFATKMLTASVGAEANLKWVWMTKDGNTTVANTNMDITAPSWPQRNLSTGNLDTNSLAFGNNTKESAYIQGRGTAAVADKWVMHQVWIKPNASIGTGPDTCYTCVTNTLARHERTITDKQLYGKAGTGRPLGVNCFDFLGYAGSFDDNLSFDGTLADDFYLAVGPNSASRFLIGSHSSWAACLDFAIATPKTWADGTVTVTLRAGPWSNFSNKWLYWCDGNNVPTLVGKINTV